MKLLCDFSGWFEIGDNVGLQFIGDSTQFGMDFPTQCLDEIKTLKEWKEILEDEFQLSDFILEDFRLAILDSTDGELDTLDLAIIED